jgi:hypothetical protein
MKSNRDHHESTSDRNDTSTLPPKKRFMAKLRLESAPTESGEPAQHPETVSGIPLLPAIEPDEHEREDASSDMEISDDDQPGKAKPNIIWLNPAFYVSSSTTLFPTPKPLTHAKNPLRAALEQHFSLMNQTELKPYHYSEVLREIAIYHRAHRHEKKPGEEDILSTILFLHEKAVVIEPASKLAVEQLSSYRLHQPLSISEGKIQSARVTRYEEECRKHGQVNFFWMALDKYIDRLRTIYPDFNARLAEVCRHLNASDTINRMRAKHVPGEQKIVASCEAFSDAAKQLEVNTAFKKIF